MDSALKLVRYDLGSQDPYDNLAAEELLLRTCPQDTIRLVFSRNAPAVIVGRNQNPWAEADLGEAARRGITVARRVSGGGAVFHDEGNLNYGFAMPRTAYEPGRFLGLIVQALASLGIAATACERHSLWVGGRKVAGTAFLLTGRTALLHGCVLVDSDLAVLRRLLRPLAVDLRGHAVASVRSPVTRLRDVSQGLAAEAVREAIAQAAARGLGAPCCPAVLSEALPAGALASLSERLRSWDWVYGRTPEFTHGLSLGRDSVVLQVRGARIAAIDAEAAGTAVPMLREAWTGCLYDGPVLAEALRALSDLSPDTRTALTAALLREVPPMACHGEALGHCLGPSSPGGGVGEETTAGPGNTTCLRPCPLDTVIPVALTGGSSVTGS
jgi:lipoate-protein ligase A